MVSCEHIRRISAYHDGELPAPEARELGRHISGCPECRGELERLRALSDWLSSAPAPEIPAGLLGRLRRSVRPQRDRVILRMAKALTAAAAAVLMVCSVLLWRGVDVGAAPVQLPSEWERAAIMPTSPEPGGADRLFDTDTEEDADVQLARSILGALSTESGYGHD